MDASGSDSDTCIESKSSKPNSKPRVHAVSSAFKPPSFWASNPTMWFTVLEADFEFSGIRSDNRKFLAVVRSLDEKTINKIADIVTHPPETEKYDSLKKALIDRISPSEDSNLQKLLKDIQLGDRKPSELLREMQTLAGTQVSNELVKRLWFQRLSHQATSILTISKEPLESLATMADKIVETYQFNSSHIMSIDPNIPSSSSTSNNTTSDLVAQINELRREVKNLKTSFTKKRDRSKSPKGKSQTGLCFYHQRFKTKALKCTQPCSWVNHEIKN